LNLELFDDNSNDDFTNVDWIGRRVDENGRPRVLLAKVLVKEDGFFNWKRVEVLEYDSVRDRYKVTVIHESHRVRSRTNSYPRSLSIDCTFASMPRIHGSS
jgi:hypothetical protein